MKRVGSSLLVRISGKEEARFSQPFAHAWHLASREAYEKGDLEMALFCQGASESCYKHCRQSAGVEE